MSDLSSNSVPGPAVTAESAGAADQPLGLTVHNLPSPDTALTGGTRRTRSGRWTMLLLLAICAAPVAASYFAYYVVRPDGRSVYGQLITPQRPLPAVAATDLQGRSVPLSDLKGQWLLLSVASGACDVNCERNLYLQRQLRESLGKDKDRLDWVWLVDDAVPIPAKLAPGLAQSTVLRVPRAELEAWLVPEAGQQLQDHLYVVDPLGHWMMRFPAKLDLAGAAKARRDLNRLLRASTSWDEAGRAP